MPTKTPFSCDLIRKVSVGLSVLFRGAVNFSQEGRVPCYMPETSSVDGLLNIFVDGGETRKGMCGLFECSGGELIDVQR